MNEKQKQALMNQGFMFADRSKSEMKDAVNDYRNQIFEVRKAKVKDDAKNNGGKLYFVIRVGDPELYDVEGTVTTAIFPGDRDGRTNKLYAKLVEAFDGDDATVKNIKTTSNNDKFYVLKDEDREKIGTITGYIHTEAVSWQNPKTNNLITAVRVFVLGLPMQIANAASKTIFNATGQVPATVVENLKRAAGYKDAVGSTATIEDLVDTNEGKDSNEDDNE